MGLDDGLFLVGAAAIAAGTWWIYPPAALVFIGLVLWAAAWMLGVVVSREDTSSEEGS